MKLATLDVLSPEEARGIHAQALEILHRKGVRICSGPVRVFLERQPGVRVAHETQTVWFAHERTAELIAGTPASFELFDRQGEASISVGNGPPWLINGHCAPNYFEVGTSARRPMTLADVEKCARLADSLPEVGVIGIQGTPRDVNPEEAFRAAAAATLRHSSKPFHFTPETMADNRAILDLVQQLSGSRGLAVKPSVLVQHTPQSPLCWPGETVEALLANASAGLPIVVLSAPYSGVSAPYPLAGQLALMHAEVLSGVVMARMARPGTPVVWGSSCASFDMATLQVSIGSPESTLLRIAGAQLARQCGLPSMTTAPDTDSHLPDSRSAWEKMHSLLGPLAAGTHLVCNGGMFSTGATACPEQILLDAEMFLVCRRILEGITVTLDTLTLEDTLAVPHAGSFLEQGSTLQFLRRDEHARPRLATRDSFEDWKRRGSRDALQRASVRVRELLGDSPPGSPRSSFS